MVDQIDRTTAALSSFVVFPCDSTTLTQDVWSSVLSFSLCYRSFFTLTRVARAWRDLASSSAAWVGSRVDLVTCYPPHTMWKMWSSASALVLEYHTLLLLKVLQKPFEFSSFFKDWQVVHLNPWVTCSVRMSAYPVFPTTCLRLSAIRCDCPYVQAAPCCISVGWTSTSSASQLARIIDGEDMIPGDDNVHVFMLHLPNVCRHPSDQPSLLEVQYIRGYVNAGIDDSRPMNTTCPLHWSPRIDMSLQMDVRSDMFRINVADDSRTTCMSEHIPVPFSTFKTPSVFYAGLPTLFFFAFVQGSQGGRCVDVRFQHTSFPATCDEGGRWPRSF